MADFKAITTQEEFDEAIKARLARERATLTKELEAKYADYGELKQKVTEAETNNENTMRKHHQETEALSAKLAEANAKIKGYELESLRRKIAAAEGVPSDFVNRLRGDTEAEITEDARALAGILEANNRKDLPGYTGNREAVNTADAALRSMAANLGKGVNNG